MSTFIKISGGQSALLQANQAQAAANRQAALERMSREKAGQQGKRERDARRKQEGLDKDGRVIFGVQPRQQPTSAPGVFLASQQGLKIINLWYFEDDLTQAYANGVLETTTGAYLGSEVHLVATRKSTDHIIICGDGSSRTTLPLSATGWPHAPTDDFTPSYATEDYEYGKRTSSYIPSVATDKQILAFPCGTGACILVIVWKYVWQTVHFNADYRRPIGYSGTLYERVPPDVHSVSADSGKNYKIELFVCNNSAVRKLDAVPAVLRDVVTAFIPEPTGNLDTITLGGSSSTYIKYSLGDYFSFPRSFDGVASNTFDSYTPEVYSYFNQRRQFVAPSLIKAFSTRLRWSLPDNSQTGFFPFRDANPPPHVWTSIFNSNSPLDYALWGRKNEYPDLSIWQEGYAEQYGMPTPKRMPNAKVTAAASRQPLTGAASVHMYEQMIGYNVERLLTLWDWNDAAYCKQMCLALGFTEADLTP